MSELAIIVVTRTDAEGFDDCITALKKLCCENIAKFYIVCDDTQKKSKPISGKVVEVLYDDTPSNPTAINKVIDILKDDTEYLFIYSKEVEAGKTHIKTMLSELTAQPEVLVVGYQLEVKGKSVLDAELQKRYLDKDLIAYRVPWNTCAIWNYQLFKKYIKRFDEVTARSPYPNVNVMINGLPATTPHRGMEDGLAIAQAVSVNKKLRYKLIKTNKLLWKVDDKDNFLKKLQRKETVMRDFMALRNYSVEGLLGGELCPE